MVMSWSIPDLSVSMSFSSSPVTDCWVIEELFAVTDTLRSFGPMLLGYHRFAKFVFRNQHRSANLAPEAKPIHQVLPLVSGFLQLFDLDYFTPECFNPDFGWARRKLGDCSVSCSFFYVSSGSLVFVNSSSPCVVSAFGLSGFCSISLAIVEWWLVQSLLESDISFVQVSPDLDFWSDASDP